MGATKKVRKYYLEDSTEEQRRKIDEAVRNADYYPETDALVSLNPDKLEQANDLVSDELFETITDEMNELFSTDQEYNKEIGSSDGKKLYSMSAKALSRALDNVKVVRNGYERPYKDVYGLIGDGKINENNKKIIAAQFLNNITDGELAKGYLDGSRQFKLFGEGTPAYGKQTEINIEPAQVKLLNSNEMVSEVKKPEPLKWYQRWGAAIQRVLRYNGDARKLADKYDADMANYTAYETTKAENINSLGSEFERREDENDRKYEAKEAQARYERDWLIEKNELNIALNGINPESNKKFIEETFKKYNKVKAGIENLPNKDMGRYEFELTEAKMKSCKERLGIKDREKMSKEDVNELLKEGKNEIGKTGKVHQKDNDLSKGKGME